MRSYPATWRRLIAFSPLLLMYAAVGAATPVYLHWTGSPLEIGLQVGVERNISIPSSDSVRVGVPSDLNHKLDIQVIGHHLWLTATTAFPSTRVIVITDSLGRLIFSLRAVDGGLNSAPVVIRHKSQEDKKPASAKFPPTHGYVTLTRWAIQQLYSPQRLLRELPGVFNVPVDESEVNLFRCGSRLPTPCADALSSVPIASWRTPHHYVTALSITNNLTEPLILDPRELRGAWRTAAFVHARLQPKGKPGDNTVLVLISEFPFENPLL